MRYVARGIAVIAICGMTASCTRPDNTGPANDLDDVVAAGPTLTPDLAAMRQDTVDHMVRLGAPYEDVAAHMDAITEAALVDEYDLDAMEAILGSLVEAGSEDIEKAPRVLNLYAESVMEGYRLDESLEPGAALGALALCNSCATAVAIPAATESCQYVSGNTTTACNSDYYRVQLPANSTCTFTFCNAECPGASGAYDTRLIGRNATTCGIGYNNDDFCGLRSQFTHNTGANPEDFVVQVTGWISSSVGSYNLGYHCTTACPYSGRLGIPEPDKATWAVPGRIFRNGVRSTCANNKGCPGSFSTGSSPRAYDRFDMPAFPSPECVTIDLTTNCPTNIMAHPVAVTGSYPAGVTWPSNCQPAPGVTYLGDSGSSVYNNGPRQPFSFDIPAGTPWSVVVMGANGPGTGCNYSFTVSPCETDSSQCAPILQGMSPSSGSAGANCDSVENLTFQLNHDLWEAPVRLDWNITPPAGGTATPSSGTMNLTRPVDEVTIGPIAFTRANCPASGAFPVDTVITNNCDPAEPPRERTFTYNLQDTTPPVFGPPEDICLWPPNHLLLCQDPTDVRPATDNCGDDGVIVGVESCVSDQADNGLGDGNTTGDCVIEIDEVSGEQVVCTRAERSGTIGSGDEGREYQIRGRARDACGNFTAQVALQTITVPHDQREHPECITPLDF